MIVSIKTKQGKILFDIEPGESMDAIIPEDGEKGVRVSLSTTTFRKISFSQNYNSFTTSVSQPEDDMVRVMVHIDYRENRSYVSLIPQEVKLHTKKVKFKDKADYIIFKK